MREKEKRKIEKEESSGERGGARRGGRAREIGMVKIKPVGVESDNGGGRNMYPQYLPISITR